MGNEMRNRVPVGVPLLLPFPTEYLWSAEYLCSSRVPFGYLCCFLFQQSTSGLQSTSVAAGSLLGYHCCFSFSLIFRSSSNRASEHRHTPTHTHPHPHAHTHTRTHALTRARTPSHSHVNTHTCTTTHTHTRRQERAGQTLFARLATGGRKVKVKNFESNGCARRARKLCGEAHWGGDLRAWEKVRERAGVAGGSRARRISRSVDCTGTLDAFDPAADHTGQKETALWVCWNAHRERVEADA